MKVALIPCGTTEWHDEGRLLGRVELPLTEAGTQQCASWAQRLEALNLRRILHSPDELSRQTAACVGRRLSVPIKTLEDLVEVDIGLWTGLTETQLKSRYPTAHRELRDKPMNVRPPGGEELSAAAARIDACIRKQFRKNGEAAVGIVMRPFSLAMTRHVLEGGELGKVWETARQLNEPMVIEYDGDVSKAKT